MGSIPGTPPLEWSPVPGRRSAKLSARTLLREGEVIGSRYIVTHDPPIIGGYGVVYTLHRNDIGADFVGKVPKYPITERGDRISAFESSWRSEALRCLAIPAHPNILEPVWLERQTRAGPMLISKKIQGATLDTVIAARNLNLNDRLLIALDALLGMEFYYQQDGQLHLDLCARNIVYGKNRMLERDRDQDPTFLVQMPMTGPSATLIDFGFSAELLKHFPKVGVDGTAAFDDVDAPAITHWSPEHLSASGTLSVRSDIYSFGILLFELLTWAPPFEPTSVGAIAEFFRQDRLAWASESDTPHCRELRRITERCLRKNGLSSYEDWSDLRADYSQAVLKLFDRDGLDTAHARATYAQTRASSIVEYWPRSNAKALGKAEQLASLGDYDAAASIATRVTDRTHWSPRARHILAHCYLMKGDRKTAIDEYDRVLSEEPSDAGARTSRGLLRLKSGDFESALVDLRIALRLHPENLPACINMAEVCVLTKRYPAAVGAYLHAMRLAPEARSRIRAKLENARVAAGWSELTAERRDQGHASFMQELQVGTATVRAGEGDPVYPQVQGQLFDEYALTTSAVGLPGPCRHLVGRGPDIAAVGDDYFVKISEQFVLSEPVPHKFGEYICADIENGILVTWCQEQKLIDVFSESGDWKFGQTENLFEDDHDIDLGTTSRHAERLFLAHRSSGTNLVAIDAKGTRHWRTSIPGGVQEILATNDDSANLRLLTASSGEVIALDGDGNWLWQFVPRLYTGLESFLGSDRIRLVKHLREWDAFIICSTVENPSGFQFDESGDLARLIRKSAPEG